MNTPYAFAADGHSQHWSLGLLNACVISQCGAQSIFNLRNLSRRYLHVEPLIIGDNTGSLPVRTLKPSEVGSDRLVMRSARSCSIPGL